MGEGHMWSPSTGWGEAKYVLESHNLTPIKLTAKEGLAMINGTQLITSIGAEAVERAGIIARQADVVAALTLEVLKGTSRAFDSGKCSNLPFDWDPPAKNSRWETGTKREKLSTV